MVGTFRRRIAATTAFLTALAAATALTALPASAETTAEIVSDNPANWTPNVLDGQVNAIAQVGNRIIIGGTFTQVDDGIATYNRTSIAAFDSATGDVDTTFNPTLDGTLEAIIPAADGTSVYIGGSFNTVNGTIERKVARVDVVTGALVAGFDTPLLLNEVRDLRLVGDELIITGGFTEVGTQPRVAMASLDADTGDLTSFVDLDFAGTHNGGITLVNKIEVTPSGDTLLAIGNFTSVDAEPRDQIVMIDLSGTTATVANWYTPFFESECAGVFASFMRDLDIDSTGTYAVISTTGAFRGGIEAGVSCDTISRYEINQTGTNLEATWVTYTGGDTSYAVEIGPGVAYVGGHMRWVNNPYDGDYAGPGAIPREGIVALDVTNGLPFSWDPGRTRGVGVFDMLLTDDGLWAGSDTDRWNNELRMKLALFPAFNGTTVEDYAVGSLRNHVDALGRIVSPGSPDPGVLYRVNAGGPAIASADDGPNWEDDSGATSSYRNSGSSSATSHSIHFIEPSVPSGDFDRVPLGVYETERWDGSSGSEMEWNFPVTAGAPLQVRLYLANKCACTDEPGQRIFDVTLDGATVIDDLDLTFMHGHETATMYAFNIVSDGSVDIEFLHEVENPLINAIEIIQTNIGGGGSISSADDVQRRLLDPLQGAGDATVTTGTEAWRWARGGFMVDTTVYTGWADGSMQMRTRTDGVWGTPTRLDLYGSNLMPDMADVTGMFFDPSTNAMYYTLDGDGSLYWRSFTPESSLLGATAFEATGAIATMNPSRVEGMFLADGWIYFADAATGDLLRIAFADGVVSGSTSLIDDSTNWRSRALVVSSNQAPTAVATAECTYRDCAFSGAGSSDPDGSLVAYDWDFGDGETSTETNPDHTYEDLGPYTATLTVTDNEGLTHTTTVDVEATNAPPIAAFSATCEDQTCAFDGAASSDSDGTIVSYTWDFGDGTGDVGPTPSHTYTTGDTYTVTLTVTDNDGDEASQVSDIDVEAALEVHLHDLTRNPYDIEGDKWVARVIVKVRDSNGDPVGGVAITASYGSGKIRTCTTNEFGKCKVKIKTADTRPKIPMEIIEVDWVGGYDAAANRDTDGDGNGETTMVWRPF